VIIRTEARFLRSALKAFTQKLMPTIVSNVMMASFANQEKTIKILHTPFVLMVSSAKTM
jgi:hypothetical protein